MRGDLLVRLLPLITLISGLLMVSRYRYVHIANVYLKGRRPFGQVVMLAFVVIIFLWRPAPALATIVCGYAASGPLTALARRVHLLGPAPVTAEPASPAAPRRGPQAGLTLDTFCVFGDTWLQGGHGGRPMLPCAEVQLCCGISRD